MVNDWPDSKEFWRDKRVIVTGGVGFLGSFVVEKLQECGAAEIIVPRSKDYDLRDINAVRRLFYDVGLPNPKSEIDRHPPRCSMKLCRAVREILEAG
jgi:FlaA1/EpsC-like NDP-sugar epimerase